MCNFLSGLALPNGDVLALPEYTDSHSDLIEHFRFKDDGREPELQRFVRVEFSPPTLAEAADVGKYTLKLDEIRARIATTMENVIPNPPKMPIRAWLAGQVLAGLCANPGGPIQANGAWGWGLVNCTIDDVGKAAASLADSTLKALSEMKRASDEGE